MVAVRILVNKLTATAHPNFRTDEWAPSLKFTEDTYVAMRKHIAG